MSVLGMFSSIWTVPSIADLSRQVAQRSYAVVRETVEARALGFARSEATGYIRAKAGPIIRTETKTLAARHPKLSPTMLATIVAQASERVVQTVLADIGRQRARETLRRVA
jgi:hypothetical protein